jgi:DNA uptake protein ComE-like DNA-binding protein
MHFLARLRPLFFLLLLAAAPLVRAETWTTLNNCVLDKTAYADGDSFHVHSGSRELIVRLYFVDCPETDERFPDRVKTQAAYFGVQPAAVVKVGEKAAEFTRRTLAKPFTVVTRFEDARGSSNEPRYYGFVLLEDGRKNFAEMLVENGLARVFGAAASRPGGPDGNAEWQRLRRLEVQAKSQQLGGWGGKVVGTGMSTPEDEEFFQRARALAAATPRPVSSTPPPASAAKAGGGIDLNSASTEALMALPKVGKVLAARIVAARPFTAIEDLQKVKGIKAETFAAIAPLVCVRKK